jgi:hypothetical protein
MQLGARLRALRHRAGLSREEAGHPIRASDSKISRMELGRVGFKERDIADLLTLYGVHDQAEREALLAFAKEANAPSWWHPYGDVTDTWLQTYLDFEEAAELIRTYEVQFIPGLLQTEAYARAVISIGYGESAPEEVDKRAQLRMERKKRLSQPNPPKVWVVLDEAVLHRPIGGRAALREQIASLLELTDNPFISIQVMPFASGGHAASGGAFSILRFPYQELSDVVYVEHLTGGLYMDKREDVDRYSAAISRLFIEAAELTETPGILHRILKDLDR